MYIVKFEQGYFTSEHHLKTESELNVLLLLVPYLLRTAIPDNNGEELKVTMKWCAEGGNPEPAHTNEQLDDN